MGINESSVEDGHYWVFFNNEWNLLLKKEDLWFWTDGSMCHNCNGCIALPVTEPRSDDDFLAALGIKENNNE